MFCFVLLKFMVSSYEPKKTWSFKCEKAKVTRVSMEVSN